MEQCEATYKIQVGSWTKLPEGKVQEDTRAIMEMMGEVCNVNAETHIATTGDDWLHLGVLEAFHSGYAVHNGHPHVVLYDVPNHHQYVIQHKPSLFIPYEELQKMSNQKVTPAKKVTSLLNTKIDCRKPDGTIDVELSKAFQEACFEQGIKWASGVTRCKNLDDCYLYVCESRLTSGSTPTIDRGYFKRHKGRQINFTYSRKLQWEAVEAEPADEIVTIGGVEYSAKELKEALELIGKAKK
jgi:hypothetical protein